MTYHPGYCFILQYDSITFLYGYVPFIVEIRVWVILLYKSVFFVPEEVFVFRDLISL